MGEGEARRRRGSSCAGRRGPVGIRADAGDPGREEGWPSSTGPTACSACSCSRWPTWRTSSPWPISRRGCRWRGCSGPTTSSRRTCKRCGPHPGRRPPPRTFGRARGQPDPGQPPVEDCPRPGRLLVHIAPQVHGAAPGHLRSCRLRRRARARVGRRQPVVTLDGQVDQWQLPPGPRSRMSSDFLKTECGGVSEHVGAARELTASLDKSRKLKLTPFLAEDPGVDSGPDDRTPRCRDRLPSLAGRRPGLGRLDPVLGDAGGPRLDGVGRGPQSCGAASTASAGCSRSRCSPPLGASPARPRCCPARRPAPWSGWSSRSPVAPDRTAT